MVRRLLTRCMLIASFPRFFDTAFVAGHAQLSALYDRLVQQSAGVTQRPKSLREKLQDSINVSDLLDGR